METEKDEKETDRVRMRLHPVYSGMEGSSSSASPIRKR